MTAIQGLLRVVSALCALAAICACGGSPAHGPSQLTRGTANKPATTAAGNERRVVHSGSAYEDQTFAPAQLWASDRDSRENALESIAATRPELLQDAWPLLLTDPDAQMRQVAVDQLTDLGGPQAIDWLETAIYDPHPAVRQAAYEGLRELGVTD